MGCHPASHTFVSEFTQGSDGSDGKNGEVGASGAPVRDLLPACLPTCIHCDASLCRDQLDHKEHQDHQDMPEQL